MGKIKNIRHRIHKLMVKRNIFLSKLICFLMICCLFIKCSEHVNANMPLTIDNVLHDNSTNHMENQKINIDAPSYILMEASTGTIIMEKNADEKRSPASITKIMTLLLTFEAIKEEKISLEDIVTVSAHAKSMGGSQVFLEEGEQQTVDTLIKCIAVASGNDASVALAEYIEGSEEAFVMKMNQKVEELQLKSTHFIDCCGLSDSDEHYTSARDVAILSKELVTNYPEIFHYTTIWMEDIEHKTQHGNSKFTLSSTNKLLKQYEFANGLKTGSTKKAGYCISATAKQNDMILIAVIMAAPTVKARFQNAKELFQYGYQHSKLFWDDNKDILDEVSVENGKKEKIHIMYCDTFSYLDLEDLKGKLHKKLLIKNHIKAPVKIGDILGEAKYYIGDMEVGKIDLMSMEEIETANFGDCLKKLFMKLLM